jgi:AcrR family transcriptional regulator
MPHAQTGTHPSAHIEGKRQRRRDEILNAALDAFRERGYHATTLDAIAARLGVRKTALYHYFPDKESILYECHRVSLAELDRIVSSTRGPGSIPGQLRAVIREHVRIMIETLKGSPLTFEVGELSPARQREVIAARDRYERHLRQLIRQGIRDGSFRSADPKLAAFAILGAINWIGHWYRPEGSSHAPEVGAAFAEHLVGGLAAGSVRLEREPAMRPRRAGGAS